MTKSSALRRSTPRPAPVVARTQLGVPPLVAAALLFFSGLAALVYQLLWIRQLGLVVGVDVYAVTTAVSAFFAGLAVGGWLLGLAADTTPRPLRLYAWLEVGVALLSVLATWMLAHAAPWFVALQASIGPAAWMLPFVLVGAPALLMGGTLPVLLRSCRPSAGAIGTAGGRLYAANTAGAIAGALLAPFALIPALGLLGSALAAALVNLLLAAAAFVMGRHVEPLALAQEPAPRAPSAAASGAGARAALLIYALAGGLALGYEVVWSQAVVQFMSTRAFAFAVVLATYLAGLVAGSALAARRADRVRQPWIVFGTLIAATGLVALLQIVALGPWLLAAQSAARRVGARLQRRSAARDVRTLRDRGPGDRLRAHAAARRCISAGAAAGRRSSADWTRRRPRDGAEHARWHRRHTRRGLHPRAVARLGAHARRARAGRCRARRICGAVGQRACASDSAGAGRRHWVGRRAGPARRAGDAADRSARRPARRLR
jgi:hypothetical protein